MLPGPNLFSLLDQVGGRLLDERLKLTAIFFAIALIEAGSPFT